MYFGIPNLSFICNVVVITTWQLLTYLLQMMISRYENWSVKLKAWCKTTVIKEIQRRWDHEDLKHYWISTRWPINSTFCSGPLLKYWIGSPKIQTFFRIMLALSKGFNFSVFFLCNLVWFGKQNLLHIPYLKLWVSTSVTQGCRKQGGGSPLPSFWTNS